MPKLITSLSLIIFFSFYLIGCGDSSTTQTPTSPNNMGTLKISLTDAPADLDEVNISFSEISAHLNNEWITVRGVDTTVNLLELSNGRSVVIGSADVPVGTYTQIRIKIDTAWVVVDGVGQELTVPSGARTGLKLGPPFTVNEGSTVELMLDFDANRSIVTTGPPQNPRSYKLKPRIRLIATAISGSISGSVSNPEHLPVAFAIAGNDTVTSTLVDKDGGEFMLAFLPEGSFVVSIADTLALAYEASDVAVTAGNDNDVGAVTLQ